MPHLAGRHEAILARYQERVREFEAIARRREPREAPVAPSAEPRRVPSERELTVLGAVADGFSNKEIAGQLTVSEETVKTHVQRLLAKLGANNRAHAVALALRAGLLDGRVAA